MSQGESEVNTDLRSLLLGSDSITGLYKMRMSTSNRSQAVTLSIKDIL